MTILHFRVTSAGCWEWTQALTPDGYGRSNSGLAHRASFEALVGPIPDWMQIDHVCRNRMCINPAHLEMVTHTENQRRGWAARYADTCSRGHPWPESAYPTADGRRKCRVCQKINQRKWYERTLATVEAAS